MQVDGDGLILSALDKLEEPASLILALPEAPIAVRRADDVPPLMLQAARSQVYQSAADAPATLLAYKADLANFTAWCRERRLEPMPSTPEIVGAYLADAGRGYALSTLRRRVAVVGCCRTSDTCLVHRLNETAPR